MAESRALIAAFMICMRASVAERDTLSVEITAKHMKKIKGHQRSVEITASYRDIGAGKCLSCDEDPAHIYKHGQGAQCESECEAEKTCCGYSKSGAGNCLLWTQCEGLTAGGGDWAGAHCFVKQGFEDVPCTKSEDSHADVFNNAYGVLVDELTLKQQALTDWLSEHCVVQKEADMNQKQDELNDYLTDNEDAWWKSAWSWIKRNFLDWFTKTQKRLENELAVLKRELEDMKTEKAQLEKEVHDMSEAIKAHKDDAQGILDGLHAQVANLEADIETYKQKKTAAESDHAEARGTQEAEDAAEVAIFTENINRLGAAVHKKRSSYYSLSATCSRFETIGKDVCKKCMAASEVAEKACGDSCIPYNNKCHEHPGCACDDVVGHDLHQEFFELQSELENAIQLHTLTINTKDAALEENQKAIEKIEADKKTAIEAYDTEKRALVALKQKLTQEKRAARAEKKKTKQVLAEETEANTAAVSKLEDELKNELQTLQASVTQERDSKTALLVAQAAKMKELLNCHATTIGDWNAKILNSMTEIERIKHEAAELTAAIEAAKAK